MGHLKANRENVVACGLYVALSPALKAELIETAQREGRTASGLIRHLLRVRLARRRRPGPVRDVTMHTEDDDRRQRFRRSRTTSWMWRDMNWSTSRASATG